MASSYCTAHRCLMSAHVMVLTVIGNGVLVSRVIARVTRVGVNMPAPLLGEIVKRRVTRPAPLRLRHSFAGGCQPGGTRTTR